MIIDSLKNSDKYGCVHPGFKEAFDFLKTADGLADGSYEIIPDAVKANISTYTTKTWDECQYECHKKYIDIQCVLNGKEQICLADEALTEITENKYEESDIAFMSYYGECVTAQLSGGDFAVIFPGEAHEPCMAMDDEPAQVRKVVVKIKA